MELQSNAPHTECKPCPNMLQLPLPQSNCQTQAMLANYQGHACSQKMTSNMWLLSAPGALKHFPMDLPKNLNSQSQLFHSDASKLHQPVLQLNNCTKPMTFPWICPHINVQRHFQFVTRFHKAGHLLLHGTKFRSVNMAHLLVRKWHPRMNSLHYWKQINLV